MNKALWAGWVAVALLGCGGGGTNNGQLTGEMGGSGSLWSTGGRSGSSGSVVSSCGSGKHHDEYGNCVVNAACPTDQLTNHLGTCVPMAGVEWSRRNTPNRWYSVASSADGSHLIATFFASSKAGALVISTDSGATWTQRGPTGAWSQVAMSADGMTLAANAPESGVYVSTDGGATWTSHYVDKFANGLTLSGNGKTLAVYGGGYIYTSADSGATWTQRDLYGTWNFLASDATGTRLLLNGMVSGDRLNSLLVSSDGGATWTPVGFPMTPNLGGLTLSADGKNAVALSDYCWVSTSSDGGLTWTDLNTCYPWEWHKLATSSDGMKLVAVAGGSGEPGYIYTSTDGGLSWTQRGTSEYWIDVTSSADGVHLVAVSGLDGTESNIYISSDSGQTWAPPAHGVEQNWTSVTHCSNDGSEIAAVSFPSYVYKSSDFGTTWVGKGDVSYWNSVVCKPESNLIFAAGQQTPITEFAKLDGSATTFGAPQNYTSIAAASDGSYIAVSNSDTSNSGVYMGLNSNALTSATLPAHSWQAAATSSNTTKIVAANPGHLYITTDSGKTWSEKGPEQPWQAVATTSNGRLMLAAANPGGIYASRDNGATWTQTGAPASHWQSLAVSPDDSVIVAAAGGSDSSDYVYISVDHGATWTARGPKAGWTSVAASKYGTALTAVAHSSGLYVSRGPSN